MKQKKHERIIMELEQIKYEIEQLKELSTLASDPISKQRIQLKIYGLEKERYILEQTINF